MPKGDAAVENELVISVLLHIICLLYFMASYILYSCMNSSASSHVLEYSKNQMHG